MSSDYFAYLEHVAGDADLERVAGDAEPPAAAYEMMNRFSPVAILVHWNQLTEDNRHPGSDPTQFGNVTCVEYGLTLPGCPFHDE